MLYPCLVGKLTIVYPTSFCRFILFLFSNAWKELFSSLYCLIFLIMSLLGKEPVELLAEPCAINGFDINRQHPSVSFPYTILCKLVLCTCDDKISSSNWNCVLSLNCENWLLMWKICEGLGWGSVAMFWDSLNMLCRKWYVTWSGNPLPSCQDLDFQNQKSSFFPNYQVPIHYINSFNDLRSILSFLSLIECMQFLSFRLM